MKFLYVAPRFHPNQYPIMQGLLEKGHEVAFCVSKVGMTEKHDGVSVQVMQPSWISKVMQAVARRKGENYAEDKMIFWFLPKYAQVRQFVKDYAPDVVIVRNRNMLSLSFVRICHKCGVKKVLLYNQSPIYASQTKGMKGLAQKVWYSLFPKKRITVCRYRPYPYTKDGFYEDANAFFMPLVPRQVLKKDREYLKDGVINIFDCGKYRPYKNHTLLVDAAVLLLEKGYTNFRITILGQAGNAEEKRYYAELKQKVDALGLNSYFNLLTSVPYDEVPGFYLTNDVFVLASGNETASVSVLDALSYGLATISTSHNGTADYIDVGKTGDVFQTRDAQDLSDKLEQYLKEPQLVREHGRQAVKAVEEKYSFEDYYCKLMKIIEEL